MKKDINQLTEAVIGCAIEIHRQLGPGLLESVYQQCLAHELNTAGIGFEMEKPLLVKYKTVSLDCGYRLDFVVEDRLIVEMKSVDTVLPIHKAQLLTYLKLAKLNLGLLINFNEHLLKNGVQRLIL